MNPLYIAIPIAVIVLIFIVMIPISKRKAAQITQDMARIRDSKVHLSLLAGTLSAINGRPANQFPSAGAYYGVDEAGSLAVEFTPSFTFGGTTYTGRSPMTVRFEAEEGDTYEMTVASKEPKEGGDIVDVTPVTTDKLIFKTTFYIVTTNTTATQNARMMRGHMA